jgi:hypothetical protein
MGVGFTCVFSCCIFRVVLPFNYSGGGARVISISLEGCLSYINYCSVVCRLSTSVYSYSIPPTSLVWVAVYGGISIFSRQLALYLAFSSLWFCAAKISSKSTGVGVACCTVLPSPCNLLIFDICGSFLALVAEPRIKTNFYSSSCANC